MRGISFAIVVDALDLLAYDNGIFDIAAAVAGFILLFSRFVPKKVG